VQWPFLTFLDASEAWKPEPPSKVEKERIVPGVSGQTQTNCRAAYPSLAGTGDTVMW